LPLKIKLPLQRADKLGTRAERQPPNLVETPVQPAVSEEEGVP